MQNPSDKMRLDMWSETVSELEIKVCPNNFHFEKCCFRKTDFEKVTLEQA